ncbi:MAG: hypothetical protein JWP75_1621 [Frondihabitans sp.]|nr:hypothetical protein [Frondihabitans sp.]
MQTRARRNNEAKASFKNPPVQRVIVKGDSCGIRIVLPARTGNTAFACASDDLARAAALCQLRNLVLVIPPVAEGGVGDTGVDEELFGRFVLGRQNRC